MDRAVPDRVAPADAKQSREVEEARWGGVTVQQTKTVAYQVWCCPVRAAGQMGKATGEWTEGEGMPFTWQFQFRMRGLTKGCHEGHMQRLSLGDAPHNLVVIK